MKCQMCNLKGKRFGFSSLESLYIYTIYYNIYDIYNVLVYFLLLFAFFMCGMAGRPCKKHVGRMERLTLRLLKQEFLKAQQL